MTSVVAPGLDELAEQENPAWLWDTARGRIAWANEAGAKWFGAASGFDLAEMVFDPADAAIAQLRDIAANLERGTSAKAAVSFPAAAEQSPVNCTCYVHNLADGRPGLLVCGKGTGTGEAALDAQLQTQALAAFPLPICLMTGNKTVLFRNQAAQDVFANQSDFDFAADLLAAAHANGTASGMRQLEEGSHRRDIRVIVRGLKTADRLADSVFLLVLEDVSERKSLERALLAMANKAQNAEEAAGESDKADDGTVSDVRPNNRPKSDNRPKDVAATLSHLRQTIERQSGKAPAQPQEETGTVPAIVASTLNSLPQPLVLIDKAGKMLFANNVAVELLEADNWHELAEMTTLADAIDALEGEDGEISLFTINDEPISFDVLLSSFPWQDGPVLQATLSPIKDGEDADNRRAPGPKKKLKKRFPR